jgi:predicted transcriptional regulator
MATASKRTPWLDTSTEAPAIAEQAKRLESFMAAIADGKVEASELAGQEKRLVAALKTVEPMLNDEQHREVTRLLCELTAYDIMQLLHGLEQARPKTAFRG